MDCQQCNVRPATVRLKQESKGKVSEFFLCDVCANHNSTIHFGAPLNINDFLLGFMNVHNKGKTNNNVQTMMCDICGLTFEKFKESGKLGCQTCYEKFEDKLDPIIKRIHGNSKYQGKIPSKLYAYIQKNNEIDELRVMLKDSIRREEYEKAAEIRDKIKELENE